MRLDDKAIEAIAKAISEENAGKPAYYLQHNRTGLYCGVINPVKTKRHAMKVVAMPKGYADNYNLVPA